ncbi:uncharacterized protein LOC122060019 [Macadamia integrifolia]|uniref:uncharacterized protein LOC122060019 n=1 Tax=Macadamia integrifolia TaxID=60698 RepID=UPI001C533068|nr:uncharacterized protein LOC122060019 [Macadamia integrifolia]XP_042479075.1 uncharacterized protein LOC122060019 [Macadamia integrifolia]
MEKQILDFSLVPLGLCLLLAYHIWLLHRIIKHPTSTILGINGVNRQVWVRTMMEDVSKNGILAVQTLRNNIMASTVLASTAIMLSSVLSIIMANSKARPSEIVLGAESELGFWIKFLSILVCFLMAFLFNIQCIRYYSHASMLINVPVKKMSSSHLRAEYVKRTVNRGSCFWSLGLRAFYFSLPLFFWLFGPIPMFLCCVVLVFMLYFLDVTFDYGGVVDEEEEW